MTAPLATYRVQLHSGFTFHDVARLAPYLAKLGISHIYCSPYLQAHEGSTHGYDVVDHTRLNEELGGRAGYDAMAAALDQHGLGHIVDIVPNHVSVEGHGNALWWDLLKHGRDSAYAHFFDIEWDMYDGKVLLPVLGDEADACIDRGELNLASEDGEPVLRYYEDRWPVAPGTAEDGDVAAVVARQHYILAYWRRAPRGLNYRRFFDINTLAALQMDQPGVFEHTHRLVLDLARNGGPTGFRIDHIDGLKDPQGYLQRLRDEAPEAYLVVEKILEPGEPLPEGWPVAGTTGYDFLNIAGGVFIDTSNEGAFTDLYRSFTGEDETLENLTHTCKTLIMRRVMASDIARMLQRISEVAAAQGWELEDDLMRVALGETIAALDVYRTYVRPQGEVPPHDHEVLRDALATARSRAPHIPVETFDRLQSILLLEDDSPEARAALLLFQQTTGPIMAKGVEDTLFYRYHRFIALNEVGGSPGHFGITRDAFHEAAQTAAERWPQAMLATSTHDTKRSEDMRARLALLSEIPQEWADAVQRFSKLADKHRSDDLPDRNTEYMFWQSLIGVWPLSRERALAFIEKAVREAKRYTSWIDQNETYERAVAGFVDGVLSDDELMSEVETFVLPLVRPGYINSLAQTLIRLTYPGVPDTYRGTELWDLSLVDPDNRRPVDWNRRSEILDRIENTSADALWAAPEDGAAKMLVIQRALQARKTRPTTFTSGGYSPLIAHGREAERALAYMRGDEIAVVVPRLVLRTGDLSSTSLRLPEGTWRDMFTGKIRTARSSLADLWSEFPVALLERG